MADQGTSLGVAQWVADASIVNAKNLYLKSKTDCNFCRKQKIPDISKVLLLWRLWQLSYRYFRKLFVLLWRCSLAWCNYTQVLYIKSSTHSILLLHVEDYFG